LQTRTSSQWTPQQASNWYDNLPWLLGCNYAPANAINQIEMWQAETFSPNTIDQELRWAASIGMNSVRVFLHDLCWTQDAAGFLGRVDQFLAIAASHGIGAMMVFFDSCWHPFPRLGRQPEPEPGVHNSGWVQSPGVRVLRDEKRFDALQPYIASVVEKFAADPRVQIWDVWNEPDNNNGMSRGPRDIADKGYAVNKLLPRVFDWIRAAKPTQPLTSGIWLGDWCCRYTMKPWERTQVELSDVISFHCYGPAEEMVAKIQQLRRYDRPLLCTEYMARGTGNTFAAITPLLKQHRVAAYNWGLVRGKSQTHLPWDSWQNPYDDREPALWFHDIFNPDGSPYRADEVELLRSLRK
jgi:hypothetical protein